MITVTINEDGTAALDINGNHVSFHEADAAAARSKAVASLIDYARGFQRLDVAALDVDGTYQLVFGPDGTVQSAGPFGSTTSSGAAAVLGNPPLPVLATQSSTGIRDMQMPTFTVQSPDMAAADTTAPPVTSLVVAEPAAAPTRTVRLHFPDGLTLAVAGPTILGRKPEPREAGQQALTVDDAGRTVSRSHALLGFDGEQLTLTDLGSANGTAILRGGVEQRLEPGAPAETYEGDTIRLGELAFTVSTTPQPGNYVATNAPLAS